MPKIGRNDPCPCGSGRKFKKCCLGAVPRLPAEVSLAFDRIRAQQEQAKKQQGLGKGIISVKHKGHRFVAVGSKLHYAKNWETFHDFLLDYAPAIIGKEWFQAEFAKPQEQWHPLAMWRKLAYDNLKAHRTGAGITSAPMSGAMFAYMQLSYNLYLLAHNSQVQARLVKRLQLREGFEDTVYETIVAATFIKAGFKLELEDEEDGQRTHCEFTATAKTGEKFSVEAKARRPHKDHVGINRQLYKALRKEANYARVVFIDVNVPDLLCRMQEIVGELIRLEETLTIKGRATDPAYVFVTNHSYAYDLHGFGHQQAGFVHGYKVKNFNADSKFNNLREALKARDSHRAIFALMKAISEHHEIPSTFDGEAPEFAFNEEAQKNRLVIGNRYIVPTPDGDQEGVLRTATVLQGEWTVYAAYQLHDGREIICTNPMTQAEILAYQRHPDTFFGTNISTTKKIEDPLEMYDFFFETYSKSSRETLLGFLRNSRDFEQLKNARHDEIVMRVCEGYVYGVIEAGK